MGSSPTTIIFLGLIIVSPLARCDRGGQMVKEEKDRSHIDNMFDDYYLESGEKILQEATAIYHRMIKPVEELYHFGQLNAHTVITDSIIQAKTLILILGAWSTGKTTIVNYLLGLNGSKYMLQTGAEPTTTDFTVLTYGPQYRTIDGTVLTTDIYQQFSSLERFGQRFLEKLQGVEMPCNLLKKVIIVDTPGIIENRKQQERGYPYKEVMKWFMARSSLVLIVFDPTKLDVGAELEGIFLALKGHESKIRIILNKADSISPQELMHVYGALFWNLSPLINVTEPPHVYVGSFWNTPFREETNKNLFIQEEVSLMMDLKQTVSNMVENRIALLRQHAKLVRLHAWITDRYVSTYQSNKPYFSDGEEVFEDIVNNPQKYNIYGPIVSYHVSEYDLPTHDEYKLFFHNNAINRFKPLSSHCSIFSGCMIDLISDCIERELPRLLTRYSQCRAKNSDDC